MSFALEQRQQAAPGQDRLVRSRAEVIVYWADRPVVSIPTASSRNAVLVAQRLLTAEYAALVAAIEVRSLGTLVARWASDHHKVWRVMPVGTQ